MTVTTMVTTNNNNNNNNNNACIKKEKKTYTSFVVFLRLYVFILYLILIFYYNIITNVLNLLQSLSRISKYKSITKLLYVFLNQYVKNMS